MLQVHLGLRRQSFYQGGGDTHHLILSYDIGGGHCFFNKAKFNVATLPASAVGTIKAETSAVGMQLNWNID